MLKMQFVRYKALQENGRGGYIPLVYTEKGHFIYNPQEHYMSISDFEIMRNDLLKENIELEFNMQPTMSLYEK